jgi:phosphoserine phosphatase
MNLTDKIEKERKKIIAVDLDGTLTNECYIDKFWSLEINELAEFYKTRATPNKKIINQINKLYNKGFIINIFTSRWDLFKEQTITWLENNGIRYNELHMNKPFYDFILDDKCVKLDEVRRIK